MHLLELILAVILAPFWFPALLMLIGSAILVIGILLICFLTLSLLFIVWILKNLYSVHMSLVTTRQVILEDIGHGFTSNMPWWRIGRLAFIKYKKQLKENREFHKQYVESQNQEEIFDD